MLRVSMTQLLLEEDSIQQAGRVYCNSEALVKEVHVLFTELVEC